MPLIHRGAATERDRADRPDIAPHVFDQTDGVLGSTSQQDGSDWSDEAEALPNRTAAGVAMLSTKRPCSTTPVLNHGRRRS